MSLYLIWFLIGAFFLIIEFMMPVFIMFFFAIGSLIVAITTALFPDLSMNFQIILFAVSSVVSLVLLRNYLKDIFKGNEYKEDSNEVNDNVAVVSKAIKLNSFGEIKYKGTFYSGELHGKIKCYDSITKVWSLVNYQNGKKIN